jgi:hypothetical protein
MGLPKTRGFENENEDDDEDEQKGEIVTVIVNAQ